ncbi:MAG TPA: hypothetical protein VE967_03635 [Gemmatimonadaceae bacterium]|nr:hypothetical protein [Gemmatimonadaceae bacterium]
MSLSRNFLAAAIAATVIGAGCAQKTDTTRKTDAVSAPTGPNVVNVKATDFAFDAPAAIPAGLTTFKLTNAGPSLHHLIIARLDSGKTVGDVQKYFSSSGPPPAWLVPVGGPNAPDPATESNATLDLKAGEYVMFCVVDVPGGVPHAAKGMIKQLTVTPSTAAPAAAPAADVKVTLADYSFTLSKPLTAGSHTIEVTTSAMQPHELELVRLAPGKKTADFMKWIGDAMAGKAPSGPPPGNAIGGVAPSAPGLTQYFTVDLTPGNYFMICFLPDPKDQKPHFAHGMLQEFTVQ